MSKLIVLGSSNAIPSKASDNTHMVLVGAQRMVLVDCATNPVVRFEQAGLDLADLTDVLITHFHPDHVSGLPLLLLDLWLMGRRKPLSVFGLGHTIDRVEDMMRFYAWEQWPNFFQVAFVRLQLAEMSTVIDCPDFHIYSSPVNHVIPTVGLRVEFPESGKTLAYSCDTEPCEQVVKLAAGADVLFHEAAGASIGHSSAAQAGEIAARAEVKSLYLIHYPTGKFAQDGLVQQAGSRFRGTAGLATDFMTLDFGRSAT
jgi:ribonuclease Z